MSEKEELTEEQKSFLSDLSQGIQRGDPNWIETALEMKVKTQLYYNWLKFVDGRGLTDVLIEPYKVKEKFKKLNNEIKFVNEMNHGLDQTCNILKTKNEKLREKFMEKANLYATLQGKYDLLIIERNILKKKLEEK